MAADGQTPAACRPAPAAAAPPVDPGALRVLHADEAWVVADKPPGLPSVPGRAAGLDDCAASRLQALYPDARIVHRLDMATSGLLLLARGAEAQRRLGAAFATRRVDKVYEAIVSGGPAPSAGEIDLPLSADWPRRPRQRVDPAGGKPSLTRWRVIGRDHDRTRLRLEPLTGRTHQLRVHLASCGWPILGDTLYAPPAVCAASPRLLLHACRLELEHPFDGGRRVFESPPPF